ncbi:MAG: chemotaxis response regulator protein-glutamate methylesterase [Spirochaetaceae bacterium]|nr:chemotaxis response regulator protein-glutamate methylesterase [Spirochaetaceae bacterium]
MDKIKVLVVDDSALMRSLISKMIEAQDDMVVVGTAMNGIFALQKIPTLNPDIIILDIEMPEMNGIEFLRERGNRGIKTPVIILSSIAEKGAQVTFEALSLGASDFITKPGGSISHNIADVANHLVSIIRVYTGRKEKRHAEPVKTEAAKEKIASVMQVVPPAKIQEVPTRHSSGKIDIVAIGISTGGPNALRVLLSDIKEDFKVPIVIVQHMPEGFTAEFAKSLKRTCSLDVKEAENNDVISKGRVLIAPGNKHITIERSPQGNVVVINSKDPVNGHRPSAGVLFNSVAEVYGNKAMGVIMTGMGRDGSAEIGNIYKAGGYTVAQDEKSSVVFGMPRVAIELGNINKILPLDDMAKYLATYIS